MESSRKLPLLFLLSLVRCVAPEGDLDDLKAEPGADQQLSIPVSSVDPLQKIRDDVSVVSSPSKDRAKLFPTASWLNGRNKKPLDPEKFIPLNPQGSRPGEGPRSLLLTTKRANTTLLNGEFSRLNEDDANRAFVLSTFGLGKFVYRRETGQIVLAKSAPARSDSIILTVQQEIRPEDGGIDQRLYLIPTIETSGNTGFVPIKGSEITATNAPEELRVAYALALYYKEKGDISEDVTRLTFVLATGTESASEAAGVVLAKTPNGQKIYAITSAECLEIKSGIFFRGSDFNALNAEFTQNRDNVFKITNGQILRSSNNEVLSPIVPTAKQINIINTAEAQTDLTVHEALQIALNTVLGQPRLTLFYREDGIINIYEPGKINQIDFKPSYVDQVGNPDGKRVKFIPEEFAEAFAVKLGNTVFSLETQSQVNSRASSASDLPAMEEALPPLEELPEQPLETESPTRGGSKGPVKFSMADDEAAKDEAQNDVPAVEDSKLEEVDAPATEEVKDAPEPSPTASSAPEIVDLPNKDAPTE